MLYYKSIEGREEGSNVFTVLETLESFNTLLLVMSMYEHLERLMLFKNTL